MCSQQSDRMQRKQWRTNSPFCWGILFSHWNSKSIAYSIATIIDNEIAKRERGGSRTFCFTIYVMCFQLTHNWLYLWKIDNLWLTACSNQSIYYLFDLFAATRRIVSVLSSHQLRVYSTNTIVVCSLFGCLFHRMAHTFRDSRHQLEHVVYGIFRNVRHCATHSVWNVNEKNARRWR